MFLHRGRIACIAERCISPYNSVCQFVTRGTLSRRMNVASRGLLQPGVCQGSSSNPTRRKSGCNPGLGELPKFWGFPKIFLQRLKLVTSNLVHSLGLPRPTIKSHTEVIPGCKTNNKATRWSPLRRKPACHLCT